MAERNFDEEFKYGELEGHTFTIGGHTFHTRPLAPPSVFLAETRNAGIKGSVDFLRVMILEDELETFNKLMDDSDPPISIEQLGEVASWLVGVTAGRPTSAPNSSGIGRDETTDSSKENSSSAEKTGES